ncbi:MAG: hypothetical protein KF734_06245 [Saprospiraceae bacterium]|nr:hypothetical protein [Saprospiraceae bacterium]
MRLVKKHKRGGEHQARRKKAILEFFEKLHLYEDELDSLVSFKFQRLSRAVVE